MQCGHRYSVGQDLHSHWDGNSTNRNHRVLTPSNSRRVMEDCVTTLVGNLPLVLRFLSPCTCECVVSVMSGRPICDGNVTATICAITTTCTAIYNFENLLSLDVCWHDLRTAYTVLEDEALPLLSKGWNIFGERSTDMMKRGSVDNETIFRSCSWVSVRIINL